TRLGRCDSEHAPCPRHALELVLTPIVELEAGPGQQVLDGSRHEHLAAARQGRDPRRDVHGEPTHPFTAQLYLAGVDARAHVQIDGRESVAYGTGAPDRFAGPVERGEEPVPGGVD